MIYAKTIAIRLILTVLIELFDVHSPKEYQILRDNALSVLVYEQRTISKDKVPSLQRIESSPHFLKLAIHDHN